MLGSRQGHRAVTVGLVALLLATSAPSAFAADPQPTPLPTDVAVPKGGSEGPSVSLSANGYVITLPHAGTVIAQTLPSAQGVVVANFGIVDPPNRQLIADAGHNPGATATVGTYGAGAQLTFYITTTFNNTTYLSTGDHARITQDGPDAWIIGWEDFTDFDFDDVVTKICFEGSSPGCARPAETTFGSGAFGNGPRYQAYQAEPVNTATGNYVTEHLDAHLPGRGLAFDFVRSYNSLSTEIGTFGIGWTHSLAARVVANPDGSATWVAEDGARSTYLADGAGGFIRPPAAYGELVSVAGGGHELTKRDQLRYRFDAAGVLVSVTDRNANAIALGYTAGRLATITDTVGRVVSLGYDAQGRLISLGFPPGRTVGYGYDLAGRLSTVTDARGGITTYTYESANRLATITDPNNHQVVATTYGVDGRVIEQVDARGFHTTFGWNPVTEISTMTDARGGQWVDDYAGGILVSQSDPLGNTTRYAFSADLNQSAVIDPRGFEIDFNYDPAANLTGKFWYGPLNYTEAWTYNSRNDPLTHRDRRGFTTTYTYDGPGNLKTVIGPPPVSPLTTYNYDPAGTGLVTGVVDPRGKTTTFGYDGSGNRDRITTPLGNVTTMTFDSAGRTVTVVDPRGNVGGANPAEYTTTFTYDAADQIRTTTTPIGHVTTVDYDPAGNRTLVTDANGHTTGFVYDDANHLTTVVDAATNRTTYAYDQVGNLTSRTDANLRLTTYGYDLAKRLTTETRPLGRAWAYEYDPNGNMVKVIDPIAAATPTTTDYQATYAYDEINRLKTTTFLGNGTANYAYDAGDNRLSMSDVAGSSAYTYDALNRLLTYRRGTRGIDYGYDAAGNVTTRTYTDGTVAILAYDDDGRPTSVVSGGATTTYGYDAAANLTSATLPSGNGYAETRTYDRSGRLTEVRNQKGTAVLSRSTYALDPVGNRLSMQTTTDSVTFTYDVLDRLTQACYTPACIGPGDNFRTYTYDPVGNRLTEARDTGTTTSTYDALDQLTQTAGPGGTTGYTYDLDGRTLTAGSQSYTWAQPGRLATATQGGTTTTYTYDGDGLRFEASTGSQANKKTQFDWDVNGALPELVAERNGSGSLLRRYVNGLDTISMTAGSKTYYFHYDGLGSVVNLTSSTGVTQWTYAYLPFGGIRTETKNNNQAPDNTLRFTGEYLDPTALYHLRARQYDPGTGRFLSTDPVAGSMTDPYVAAYLYAGNSPVLYTDPSGRCFGPLIFLAPACIGAAIGIGSYVVSTVATNVLGNVVESRDPLDDPGRGLNPLDAGISATAGVLGGPIGAISFGPTRVLAGGALGCTATFASQAAGGRSGDLVETTIGCVTGGAGSIFELTSKTASAFYGTIIALAQAVGTYAEQHFGTGK